MKRGIWLLFIVLLIPFAVAVDAPTTEIKCANGVDEDGDGLTDCDDSDCVGNPRCAEATTTAAYTTTTESCEYDEDCTSGYCENSVCVNYEETSDDDNCVSNDECDTTNGYVCDGTLFTCVLPADVADIACDDTNLCDTGYTCVDGGCIAEVTDPGFTAGPGAFLETVSDALTETAVDIGYAGLSKITDSAKLSESYANFKTKRSAEKLAENGVNKERVQKGQMSEKSFSKKTAKNTQKSLKGLDRAQVVVSKSGSQTAQAKISALASKSKTELTSLEQNKAYKQFAGSSLEKAKTSYNALAKDTGISKSSVTFDCVTISSGEQVQGVTYIIDGNCLGVDDAVVCNDGSQWEFYGDISAYSTSGTSSGSSVVMIYSGDQYDFYFDGTYFDSGSLGDYGIPVLTMDNNVIYTYDSTSFMMGKKVLLKAGSSGGVEACSFVNSQSAMTKQQTTLGTGMSTERLCANGVDEDDDGLIDCDDDDCSVKAVCMGQMAGSLTTNAKYVSGVTGTKTALDSPLRSTLSTTTKPALSTTKTAKTSTQQTTLGATRTSQTRAELTKPALSTTTTKPTLSTTTTKPTLSTTTTKPTLSATTTKAKTTDAAVAKLTKTKSKTFTKSLTGMAIIDPSDQWAKNFWRFIFINDRKLF